MLPEAGNVATTELRRLVKETKANLGISLSGMCFLGDSWMYPYQWCVFMGCNPQEFPENTTNTMGPTLSGVHPIDV